MQAITYSFVLVSVIMHTFLRLIYLGGVIDQDYVAGIYVLTFTEGTALNVMECVTIETINDNVLEGDHDFVVLVDDISPNGAVVASENLTVTITDAADGGHFTLSLYYFVKENIYTPCRSSHY